MPVIVENASALPSGAQTGAMQNDCSNEPTWTVVSWAGVPPAASTTNTP